MAQNNKQDNLKKIVNIHDFEEVAKKILTPSAYTYYRSGANDEISLRENSNAWKNIYLKQKVLQDIDNCSTESTILGRKISCPIGVAPTAMHGLADAEGECATAKACQNKNVAFCLSTLSNFNQEDVQNAQDSQSPNGFRWFQLYAVKDQNATIKMIKKAEKLGYQAIVLTVDVPVFGKRDGDEKNNFKLPDHLQLKILEEQVEQFDVIPNSKSEGSMLSKFSANLSNSHWGNIVWIKEATKLPIVLKGILCPEDAAMAVKLGFDAVWVSNHGARQLDGAIPPIEALPEIAKICKGKCEVYVDGGVRRGGDIFKALALGANCVFVGRPSVFALAAGGQKGVEKMIQILTDEFKKTMQLCGCKTTDQISPYYLMQRNFQIPRL